MFIHKFYVNYYQLNFTVLPKYIEKSPKYGIINEVAVDRSILKF